MYQLNVLATAIDIPSEGVVECFTCLCDAIFQYLIRQRKRTMEVNSGLSIPNQL